MDDQAGHGDAERYPFMLVDDSDRYSEALSRRFARAWEVARTAAAQLKLRFGATRVVVFGSLTDRSRFTKWSDIDLVAWGISDAMFWTAVGAVTGLTPDFRVDLVHPDDCRPSMLEAIRSEGVEL